MCLEGAWIPQGSDCRTRFRTERNRSLFRQCPHQSITEQHGALSRGGIFSPVAAEREGRGSDCPIVAVEIVKKEQAVPILRGADSGHQWLNLAALLIGEGLIVFADDEGFADIAAQRQGQQAVEFAIAGRTVVDAPVVAIPGWAGEVGMVDVKVFIV